MKTLSTRTPSRVGGEGSLAFSFLSLLLGLVALVLPDPRLGLTIVGCVSILFSVGVMTGRGGLYLVPSSVFLLASGVFIGLAALYLSILGSRTEPGLLRDVTVAAHASIIFVHLFADALTRRWGVRWPTRREGLAAATIIGSCRPPIRYNLIAVLFVVSSQISPLRDVGGPMLRAAGLAGVVMLTLMAAARRVWPRSPGEAFFAAGAVLIPLMWVRLEFGGGGRLTLAGIGIAAMVALNLVKPHAIHKVVVVLGLPIFLAFAGVSRIERRGAVNDSSVIDVVSSGTGLASLYGPLDTLGEVVARQSQGTSPSLGPRWGETFLNTLFLPIPREVWSNKPLGFGAELTQVLRPELAGKEHSMAALSHGEWFVNFGWAGLLLMVVALGWFLAVLDRWHACLAWQGLYKAKKWWSAAVLLCLVSSLADLLWVGTFTFFARGGLAAIIVFVVSCLANSSGGHRIVPGARDRLRSR